MGFTASANSRRAKISLFKSSTFLYFVYGIKIKDFICHVLYVCAAIFHLFRMRTGQIVQTVIIFVEKQRNCEIYVLRFIKYKCQVHTYVRVDKNRILIMNFLENISLQIVHTELADDGQ